MEGQFWGWAEGNIGMNEGWDRSVDRACNIARGSGAIVVGMMSKVWTKSVAKGRTVIQEADLREYGALNMCNQMSDVEHKIIYQPSANLCMDGCFL